MSLPEPAKPLVAAEPQSEDLSLALDPPTASAAEEAGTRPAEPKASSPTIVVRRRGRRSRGKSTTRLPEDDRYDRLGLSDWSYDTGSEVVSDPDQDEVDRILVELFPVTRGGVPDNVYTDFTLLNGPAVPEVDPDADSVLDMLDGADVAARAAPALQERRARRVEEKREAARRELLELALEEKEAAERAERERRAEEVRNASAAEEARRAVETDAELAPEQQAAMADPSVEAGSTRAGKTWSAPVVVPVQPPPPTPPQPPSRSADIPVAVSRPRTEDGLPQIWGRNVLPFPVARRSNPTLFASGAPSAEERPKRRGRPPGRKAGAVTPRAEPPIPPAPETVSTRLLTPSAHSLLTATFPLQSSPSVDALRARWFRTKQHDTDVLQRAKAALPSDCIRWRVRNGEVPFSEVVASVMTAGARGARFLLFHDVHSGVAAIDVRCPRPQLVERWSRCIYVAKASFPAGHMLPPAADIDAVARLRVDLSVSTLVGCLEALGLGLCVGSVRD